MVLLTDLDHNDDEILMGNHEEEDKSKRKSTQESKCLGTFIGVPIQVVSLGAYAIMLLQWGDDNYVVHQKTEGDWSLYTILLVLQCAYLVIWISFSCSITRVRSRMAMLRDQFQTPAWRRFAFVSGVLYFLVLILMGALLAFLFPHSIFANRCDGYC
jgi:hypothetical protein